MVTFKIGGTHTYLSYIYSYNRKYTIIYFIRHILEHVRNSDEKTSKILFNISNSVLKVSLVTIFRQPYVEEDSLFNKF